MTAQAATSTDVLDDLEAEMDHLHGILATLTREQWHTESGAAGWTVSDVILHLAISEESVAAAVRGERSLLARGPDDQGPVDVFVHRLLTDQRGAPPADVFARWRAARRLALQGLRAAAPKARLPWVAGQMSPTSLATTRLAEHWAHGLDIAEPLGLPYPDTARLRHVAWLAHRQLPYSFQVAGEPGGPVRCELDAPDGTIWRLGDSAAPSTIEGSAGEFCRVAAQRMRPDQTTLRTFGPHGQAALRVARTYAA